MPPDATAPALQPQPAAKALTCPSCGGSVTLRAAGYTVSVACQYCGSILDVTNPQVQLITQYKQATDALEIPLGTRGVLGGIEWEAIGYLQRSMGGEYPWEEYLLFNPYHGYRWLVNSRGGWSLGEMQTSDPGSGYRDALTVRGQLFEPFWRDDVARVDAVLGEFYWRVSVGERVTAADWVRPGWMLSREENDNETSWTLSRLLEPKEMAAFGVRMHSVWPPLPHQPSPYPAMLKTGGLIAAAVLGLMIVLMMVFGGDTWTAAGDFPVPSGGVEKTATLGPLTFNRAWQRVEIRANVPALENGWVDLDYALVNRTTQERYEAYGAAERYAGSDSDGPWTEGTRQAQVSISSVPAGTYDLEVDYKGNDWSDGSSSFSATTFGGFGQPQSWMNDENHPNVVVEVRQGALYPSNFLIALIAVLAPLLFAVFGHLRFENARQSESDLGATGFAALLNKSSEDDDD